MRLLARWLRALSRREPPRQHLPPAFRANPRLRNFPLQGSTTMQPLRDYDDKMMRAGRDYQNKEAN